MATLTHPKGRTVVVPDETVEYYTSKGWSVAGEKPAKQATAKSASGSVEIPDGEPSDKWSNKQLDAYAVREGIDLGAPKNKGDRLTAIAEGRKVDAGTGDAGDDTGNDTSAE